MKYKGMRGYFSSLIEMKDNLAFNNYIIDENNYIYHVKVNEIGVFSAMVRNKEEYNSLLPLFKKSGIDKVDEGFCLHLPKIPGNLLNMIVTFFKRFSNQVMQNEVMAQIFWNIEYQEYFIYIPKQIVSGTRISLERNSYMDSKHLLVLDIHSHNIMDAFFSSIDDADELETRLYAVVGRLGLESKGINPKIKTRASCEGKFIPIDITDITERFDINKHVDFPEGWIKKIEFY